jgi:hypothetical protein
MSLNKVCLCLALPWRVQSTRFKTVTEIFVWNRKHRKYMHLNMSLINYSGSSEQENVIVCTGYCLSVPIYIILYHQCHCLKFRTILLNCGKTFSSAAKCLYKQDMCIC